MSSNLFATVNDSFKASLSFFWWIIAIILYHFKVTHNRNLLCSISTNPSSMFWSILSLHKHNIFRFRYLLKILEENQSFQFFHTLSIRINSKKHWPQISRRIYRRSWQPVWYISHFKHEQNQLFILTSWTSWHLLLLYSVSTLMARGFWM